MIVVAILVCAGLGAVARAELEVAITRGVRHARLRQFPWGLLVVNVLGCIAAGAIVARTTGDLRLLLLGGFCGAFTTFSGFAREAHRLWRMDRMLWCWTVLGMTIACVTAFAVTWLLLRG